MQKLLEIVKKAGFSFYGYNENGEILVNAPNGQIISVLIAYKFLREQKKRAEESNSSSGNLNQPSIPSFVDAQTFTEVPREQITEKIPNESRSEIIKPTEESSSTDGEFKGITTLQTNDTKKEPVIPKPFSIGFEPQDFDPTNLNQVKKFIDSNTTKGSNDKSNKWLAVAFDKWIKEFLASIEND